MTDVFDRRTVLKGAGGAVTSMVVAGCSGADPDGSSDSTPTALRTPGTCDSYTTLGRADVNGGATIEAGCYRIKDVHTIDSGTLTLRARVLIEFDENAGLEFVDSQASTPRLVTEGTANQPVFLRGRTEQRGHWKGVRFKEGRDASSDPHSLTGVIIEHAGSELWHGADFSRAGVFIQKSAVEFHDAGLRHNKNWALSASKTAAQLDVSGTNFLFNEGTARVHADLVGGFDGTTLRGNDDDRIRVDGGSGKDVISTDQTWTDHGVPYYVSVSLDCPSHLTIESGTVLQFAANKGLDVNGGALTVNGTASAAVRFRGDTTGRGSWQGIRFKNSDSPNNSLEHVEIQDAGGELWTGSDYSKAGVFADGNTVQLSIAETLFFNNDVSGLTAKGNGFDVTVENSRFSENRTPIHFEADLVDGIGPNNAFASNDNSYVLLGMNGRANVRRDATWNALDVPYRTQHRLDIRSGLELEPGTTVVVEDEKQIMVVSGYLLADASGSNADPITVTGANEQPGHWGGIGYKTADANNVLKNAVVEYGGGQLHAGSGSAANIVVGYGPDGVTPELQVSDTTVRESGKHGIYINGGSLSCSNIGFSNNAGEDIAFDGGSLGNNC